MIRKLGLCLALFIVCGCKDTIVEEFSLQGTLQGNVGLYDQFYLRDKEDPSGTRVVLKDSLHVFTTYCNRQGGFSIENIPTGVYDILIEKAGFVTTADLTKVSVVGGDAPVYKSYGMYRASTSYITNFSLEYSENWTLAKGIVNHSWTGKDEIYWPGVPFVFFISTSPTVSPQNYQAIQFFTFYMFDKKQFVSDVLGAVKNKFTSGTTLYVVGYGYSGQVIYDLEANRYIVPGLGSVPSEVKSLTLK